MTRLLTPARRRGVEYLDDRNADAAILRRSLADVARSNALFGGTSAVIAELDETFRLLPARATLLDVGTGIADIPQRARERARAHGIRLETYGLDEAEPLAAASRARTTAAVRGDALALPFGDRSVDIVLCSQVLHHFPDEQAAAVVEELHRVARTRVIIADLRRSWMAIAGIWLASYPLRFHPVSRHDGVVSVFRGYTADELRELIQRVIGRVPRVRTRWAFRITASWCPVR
ncbi:MAG TPA: methyltransferase domain-containing protein [Gemmatimonadaceae bacterium]|nr:methyltransferase domain-containing protein [Gemmatimonadaceae bacterium]